LLPAENIAEPVGSLDLALSHASKLLARDPRLAAQQAQEILKVVPGHPNALLLLGVARRWAGDPAAARPVLEGLVRSQPRWAQAYFELGQTLSALAEEGAALAALREATRLKPDFADAWRAQGDILVLAGDGAGADQAYARHIKASVNDPRLVEAALALCDNRLSIAERLLREQLKAIPTDVAAIRMLAEVGTRLGRYGDAENLLARCLELAPSFAGARHNYATVLYRQNKAAEAIPHIEWLLQREPRNPGYRNLMAAALGLVGEYARAIALYEQILAEHADQPKVWLSYGHALKTAGRQADAVEAYQRCVHLAPGFGEAYWSLANLKTVRFSDHDVEAMSAQLQRANLEAIDRFHLHYSLGKALEDAGDDARAFEHYAEGARLRRAEVSYDAEETTEHVRCSRALFTPAFFAERAGQGCDDAAPIFVLGLPRSGSTLIEQILASHSAVEGTMELPEIVAMARTLGREAKDGAGYPKALADLDAEALAELGRSFIARTRVQRKSGKPFFIDKMPNNMLHVGLIHLILPNAKIIDARRHPMGACFSAFKQHFARGQHYSYDLTEVGRYYRDYVELMAHFDAALPGRIHRVIYERMVEDTEGEVRRLLDYCGLPFEDGCLRFYENDRAVRTASSEQVRRPIFRDGLDRWRRFEPWLDPLKAALGPLVETYPDIPSDRPGVGGH
jgi:tetratricopeptide (TPR) repeat protein